MVSLDDHFDWAAGYQDKVLPFAWQDMTFDGKVYGLPYYADTITFMYNARVLEDAGIAAPPQTWEEVTEQSLTAGEPPAQPRKIVVVVDIPQEPAVRAAARRKTVVH